MVTAKVVPTNTPKPVCKRRERVLIWVKDINELTVLPLVSAIQAYASNGKLKHAAFCSIRNWKSDYEVAIDLVLPPNCDEFSSIFLTLVPSITSVVFGNHVLNASIYDCIFDLEEEDARAIGLATGKHLAQSYGIMLGSEAPSIPLGIENLCQAYTPRDQVLTLYGWDAGKLIDRGIPAVPVNPLKSLAERIRLVFECKGYAGLSCFESYLAACLNKPVLEINFDDALTKWSSPNYCRLIQPTPEGWEKGLKLCFPSLLNQGK